MDEPSYENEAPKIRVIDVIDQQQQSVTTTTEKNSHYRLRQSSQHRRRSPPIGEGSHSVENVDDDDPDRGILPLEKRLSPDGASNNNADEVIHDDDDDVKTKQRRRLEDRLSAKGDDDVDGGGHLHRGCNGNAITSSQRHTPDGSDHDVDRVDGVDNDDDGGGGGGSRDHDFPARPHGEAWQGDDDEIDDDDKDASIDAERRVVGEPEVNGRVMRLGEDEDAASEASDVGGEATTPKFGLGTDDSHQSLVEEFNGLEMYGNGDRLVLRIFGSKTHF